MITRVPCYSNADGPHLTYLAVHLREARVGLSVLEGCVQVVATTTRIIQGIHRRVRHLGLARWGLDGVRCALGRHVRQALPDRGELALGYQALEFHMIDQLSAHT